MTKLVVTVKMPDGSTFDETWTRLGRVDLDTCLTGMSLEEVIEQCKKTIAEFNDEEKRMRKGQYKGDREYVSCRLELDECEDADDSDMDDDDEYEDDDDEDED